ncbi:MAG: 1,6-anhydro-N-acetylmuramyl-L-alanine amidase AmpD [Gammaproteobacteria bacterium]|nr:1,6-anhydro-N-acetylmuramyl-L-alanine amidase AmpD [Gammaproteobacteria bacterium]
MEAERSVPYLVMDCANGWLDGVRHLPSPNFDPRPAPCTIDLVVVHGISLPPGQYGGGWIDRLFTNTLDPQLHPFFSEIQGLRVSAHVLIERNGDVTQYVSFNDRAWHAGQSCFEGRVQCNDFSIGIELEGCDTEPYQLIQYTQLARVIAAVQRCHPHLTAARITGHSDIAPGRKTDPGPNFDWGYLRQLLMPTPSADA